MCEIRTRSDAKRETYSEAQLNIKRRRGAVPVPKVIRGGFLIRRSSAIRRFFAGFLRCDSCIIMTSFLHKIPREFTGNLHTHRTKFPENSPAIFLRKDFIIVRLSHLRNPAKNLRIAELRLMRNPSQNRSNRSLASAR